MMNQAFDIFEHVLASGDYVTVIIGNIPTRRHVIGRLFNNSDTLSHLLNPHQIAGITVAFSGRGNLKLKIFVARIGHLFTQVPIQATAAQIRAGHTPVHGFLQGDSTNALGARLKNGIFAD